MDSRLKEILHHLRQELYITIALLVVALALTYIEDLLKYLDRPKWLIEGTGILSMVLFVIAAVLLSSIAAITVYHSIKDRWKNS